MPPLPTLQAYLRNESMRGVPAAALLLFATAAGAQEELRVILHETRSSTWRRGKRARWIDS
jgi:hypothetical protein